jgi:hypothetical protein
MNSIFTGPVLAFGPGSTELPGGNGV